MTAEQLEDLAQDAVGVLAHDDPGSTAGGQGREGVAAPTPGTDGLAVAECLGDEQLERGSIAVLADPPEGSKARASAPDCGSLVAAGAPARSTASNLSLIHI